MSVRLYVGQLPKEFELKELEELFSTNSAVTSTKLVTDNKTGKCRGFAFVTVETDEQADGFIEAFNGTAFKESTLKIEKARKPEESGNREGAAAKRGGAGGGARTGSGGRSGGGRRASGGGGVRRSGAAAVITDNSAASAKPDPRWANELEQLKARLGQASTGS